MAEDKGHKPTHKKLNDARKKGKVGKSQLFTQSLGIIVFIGSLSLFGESSWISIRGVLEYCFASGNPEFSTACAQALKVFSITLIKLLLPVACAGFLCETLQVGLKVETAVLLPDFSRVSPGTGISKLVVALRQYPIGIFKAVLFGTAAFHIGRGLIPLVVSSMSGYGLPDSDLITLTGKAVIPLAVLFVCWGVFDCILGKRRFLKEMSMSTDELKREHRESEGDPMLKHMRRNLHESILMHDLVKRVRSSKVVVVEKK